MLVTHYPMRIVLINPEYPSTSGVGQGGTATYLYALAHALCAQGLQVHLLVKEGITPQLTIPVIAVHTYGFVPPRGIARFGRFLHQSPLHWEQGLSRGARMAVDQIHQQAPIDIVEIPDYNGLAHAFAKPRPYALSINFRTPRVLIDALNHRRLTPEVRRWHRYEARALRSTKSYRTSSAALQQQVQHHFRIAPAALPIIANPIDIQPYRTIARKLDTDTQQWNILFAGRLERRKGAEILLSSSKALLDIHPSVTLTFAGETDLRESTTYQDAIERTLSKEQRQRVWFLGPTPHHRLAVLYRSSDVLLFPSLFENSPNTLLEALACELPVVAANSPGVDEIIEHKHTGLLFNPAAPLELVDMVQAFFANRTLAQSCAANGLQSVQKNNNPAAIALQTIAYYQRIMQEQR